MLLRRRVGGILVVRAVVAGSVSERRHAKVQPFIALPFALALPAPANELQLITQAEASLPAAPATQIAMRGLTRGPSVDQLSPSPTALIPLGPLTFNIAFEAHNGSAVDPTTVKLTYLKQPAIDLTQRLRPYITAAGIKASDVDVPPGVHAIRIDLADTQGRTSSMVVMIQVTAK
jgi:hypothetical protein